MTSTPNDTIEPKRTFTILVVDDNMAAAFAIAKLLEHFGHSTNTVHAGEDVLPAVEEHGSEVIFLDVGLPDINGLEVARRLRSAGLPVRIIGLSGYGQEEDKRVAREAGFDAHLTKPASLSDIQTALREVTQDL